MKAPVTTATRCRDCGERLGAGVRELALCQDCAGQRFEDKVFGPAAPDLDALTAWLFPSTDLRDRMQDRISPSDLQRPPWHLTWNGACAALEALEARGDLERVPGPGLVWKLRQKLPQGQCRATVPGDSRTCLAMATRPTQPKVGTLLALRERLRRT